MAATTARIFRERPIERRSDSFAREVVRRRAEAAGEYHQIGPLQGTNERGRQVLGVVSHHHFFANVDADLVETLSEVQRIGVEPRRRQ